MDEQSLLLWARTLSTSANKIAIFYYYYHRPFSFRTGSRSRPRGFSPEQQVSGWHFATGRATPRRALLRRVLESVVAEAVANVGCLYKLAEVVSNVDFLHSLAEACILEEYGE